MESHNDTADTRTAPAMTAQQKKYASGTLSDYREFAVGNGSWLTLLHYELYTCLFSNLPGLPGFATRSLLYPSLFKSCGARPAIGRGVILRNPGAMTVGKKLLLDDYAVMDVRGEGAAITAGDFVSVGRASALVAKSGIITLGNGVNIGSSCRVATQSKVVIGDSTLIAAYSYIGPGNHQAEGSTALIESEMEIKGGVVIGSNCWIATRATILDGVTIGNNAIVGAHSLVKDDVPAGTIVAGIPAKIIGNVSSQVE